MLQALRRFSAHLPFHFGGEERDTEFQAQIHAGIKLTCLDDEDIPAKIFESPGSHVILGTVAGGERVEAAGKPVEIDGYIMVPIKPKGAVWLDDFEISGTGKERDTTGAKVVDVGTMLTCLDDEDIPAKIFASPGSHLVLGTVAGGESVEAAGKPVEVDGYIMVPIKPKGAVWLDDFGISEGDTTEADARRGTHVMIEKMQQEIEELQLRLKATAQQDIQEMLQDSNLIVVQSDSEAIKVGSMLRCTVALDDHPAKVYESLHSHEVVNHVQPGETIIASGPQEIVGGCVMVPVKPSGAVDMRLFEVRSEIKIGCTLHCTIPSDANPAEVYKSARSDEILGHVLPGGTVIADGPPVFVEGHVMVPVKASGAVDLDLFALEPAMKAAPQLGMKASQNKRTQDGEEQSERISQTGSSSKRQPQRLKVPSSTPDEPPEIAEDNVMGLRKSERISPTGRSSKRQPQRLKVPSSTPDEPPEIVEDNVMGPRKSERISQTGRSSKRQPQQRLKVPSSTPDELPEIAEDNVIGPRKSHRDLGLDCQTIKSGSRLRCTVALDDHPAKIYESTGSHEVLEHVQHGEIVTADGPAEIVEGNAMVPVKPRGAVEFALFSLESKTKKASEILEGEVMTRSTASWSDKFFSQAVTRVSATEVGVDGKEKHPRVSRRATARSSNRSPSQLKIPSRISQGNQGEPRPSKSPAFDPEVPVLHMTIVGATVQQNAKQISATELRCGCRIEGDPDSLFWTPEKSGSLKPLWNHERFFSCRRNQILELVFRERGEELAATTFCPSECRPGLNCPLELDCLIPGVDVMVTVRMEWVEEMQHAVKLLNKRPGVHAQHHIEAKPGYAMDTIMREEDQIVDDQAENLHRQNIAREEVERWEADEVEAYLNAKITILKAEIKQASRQILATRLSCGFHLTQQPDTVFYTHEQSGLNPVWNYQKRLIARKGQDSLELFLCEADDEIAKAKIKLSECLPGVPWPCNLECIVPGVTVTLTVRIDWLQKWDDKPLHASANVDREALDSPHSTARSAIADIEHHFAVNDPGVRNFPQAEEIGNGSWLRCILDPAEEPADVLEAAGSLDIIDSVLPNEVLLADGPPEVVDGLFLVPVKPHGVVELDMFEVMSDWAHIQSGTLLICSLLPEDEAAEIYEASHLHQVIGHVESGEVIIADGTLKLEQRNAMVPMMPHGAVELNLFRVLSTFFDVAQLPVAQGLNLVKLYYDGVRITIFGASGLRNIHQRDHPTLHQKPDPFVTCAIRGREEETTFAVTHVAAQTVDPIWDSTRDLPGFYGEDGLIFTVLDHADSFDNLLGEAVLMPEDMQLHGGGRLELSCQGTFATVDVKVEFFRNEYKDQDRDWL